jgi:hypothetical protein
MRLLTVEWRRKELGCSYVTGSETKCDRASNGELGLSDAKGKLMELGLRGDGGERARENGGERARENGGAER